MKTLSLLSAGVISLLLLPSCEVMDGIMGPPRVPDRPLPPAQGERPVTDQRTQLEDMRDRVDPDRDQNTDDNYLGNSPTAPEQTRPTTPRPPVTPPVPKKFPYATMAPNRPGFVLSPYNGAEIDVRGLKSGTLVRDPADPNPDHKFYVP